MNTDYLNTLNGYGSRCKRLHISFLLLFVFCFSVSLDAKDPIKPKYFPLGVCQKAENSQLAKNLEFDYLECSVGDLDRKSVV